jgi:hypothetical protein
MQERRKPTIIHKIDRTSEHFKQNPNRLYWTSDDSACEICGERFKDGETGNDMFDPNTEEASVFSHKSCGAKRNLELV